MATIPTQEESDQIKQQNQQDIEEKIRDQAAQGKGFALPLDGHGPGVIPEETWQNLPGKIEVKQ